MTSSASSSSSIATSTSASSSSSSSGNQTSSITIPSSSSNPLSSASPTSTTSLTSMFPISSLSSTSILLSYAFSEIPQPLTTSIPTSMPPTPSIGESNPLFSILHQQQTFPTSTAAFWTLPQSVLPRALFPPTTPPMGIDHLASGLHGLNLLGGLHTHIPNNGGLIPSLPNSSPFFSSALAAPNVTNLVTVKLTTIEDYLTWKRNSPHY